MRIHSSHIRAEIHDLTEWEDERRTAGGEPPLTKQQKEAMAAQVLRRYLIANLSDPKVSLDGKELPAPGELIHAGQPATPLPDDTPVGVVEALVRAFSRPGDSICFLYGRSLAPIEVCRRLDRHPVLVDPYADCLEFGYRTAWDSKAVVECLLEDEPDAEMFELLLFHLPAPGVVDREAFLYPDCSVPCRPVHWESLSRQYFFDLFEKRVSQWSPTLSCDGRFAVLSTPSSFDGEEQLMLPFVAERMAKRGWELERRYPVQRPAKDSPIRDPALRRANLAVFRRGGHDA